jgi:hypothetical protein
MEPGGAVIAQTADVSGAHAPSLTGNDSAGDLAARQHIGSAELNFGALDRVVRKRDNGIGGVQPNADKVNLRQILHIVTVNGV